MRATIRPPAQLRGTVQVPGDKSISHRALIFNAVGAGPARLENVATGGDVASTASCLRALGVTVTDQGVDGVGLHGLRAPHGPLDCGNSGTTMRLLAGLLAGQSFETTLVGDESLSRRPMDRIAVPLARMGARTSLHPLRVGGGHLKGVVHEIETPSAQVKSALLLAGLQADGVTRIVETVKTRDHSERMLTAMTAPIRVEGNTIEVRRTDRLDPLPMRVPGDLSAAAFWIVAAVFHPRAQLALPDVGVNPTRAGILRLLPVARIKESREGGEPMATLHAATLRGIRPWKWSDHLSAELIDELPVLAVAATQISGRTVISGAAELRLKESDRIAAMSEGLKAMGARIEERPDGWEIEGPVKLQGALVSSFGDHRVAMALAVAGLLAEGETEVEGAECVSISYPAFWDQLNELCG